MYCEPDNVVCPDGQKLFLTSDSSGAYERYRYPW
jgi:hypothetical protein